jgi:hypothetical protein
VPITFQGADATSGVDSCTQVTYAGPDDSSVALSGTCRDRAGNESASSPFTLRYDETPPLASATPSRGEDVNGWYNHALTVSFSGSDSMSGLDSCDAPTSYTGPDSASASVTGSCRDRAGNAAPRSFALRYDSAAPQVTAAPGRPPNANGWYNAPVNVSFNGSDAIAGIESCSTSQSYSGPDNGSARVDGTCTDRAGNVGSGSFPLRYDVTAPQVTATPARPAGQNGWYSAPLGVSFAGTDATAGIDACDPAATYSGPDSASAVVSGSCRDRAGNSASRSFPLRYDATAPQVTASPARAVDVNGWYNHSLGVSFTGSDAISGLATCDAARSYTGPDSASTSVAGSCRDNAGNTGSGSFGFRYDATAPQASATASRGADANGWYNHALTVSFAATDAMAGVDSCDAARSYSGPDVAAGSVAGACRDRAGNARQASLALNYDATAPAVAAAPSRGPDANGWYNHPLAVGFAGSDATSGVDSCTGGQSYAGPDTSGASFSGSCRDRAGNQSAPSAFVLRYDATAPLVAGAIAVRPPDRAGWYNRPVTFAVEGSDTTSGIDACPPLTYRGPDGAEAAVDGMCVDTAGNRASRSFPLRYDATGPATTATADRLPDANGWYNHALVVAFAGLDSASGTDSCTLPQSYDGPDGAEVVIGGNCIDRAGNLGLAALPVSYDATAPQVMGAHATRPPDANGWYNRPLGVTFKGSDATSQVDTCTVASYSGPDTAGASVPGSCLDRAGNASASAPFPLRYDSTAPSLTQLRAKAGNGTAQLSWIASPDTTLVELRRSGVLVYSGSATSFADRRLKNGVRYRYLLTGYDEAGNTATSGVAARPIAPLVSPPAGATVSAPPRLAWLPAERATYYNVQLWRGGKILSAWPKGTSLRLRRTWTYGGRQYRLKQGRYRWYVWPGYGRRAEKRFGSALGSSSFVVR